MRKGRFAFMSWFDGLVISGLEGVAKPDRRIFEILLDRYQLEPQECVFVDDSARNVDVARELGMIGLHYISATRLRAELEGLGVMTPAIGQSGSRGEVTVTTGGR